MMIEWKKKMKGDKAPNEVDLMQSFVVGSGVLRVHLELHMQRLVVEHAAED